MPFAWMAVGMVNFFALCYPNGPCEPEHIMLPLFSGTISVIGAIAMHSYSEMIAAFETNVESIMNHDEE